jgi:undecaprenyl diphosphate synthase
MLWKNKIDDNDSEIQSKLITSGGLPAHIAIIMDGNGRWASMQNIPRLSGHKEGIESVRDIVKACSQLDIKFLTLYAFSIENWKRPKKEIKGLMKLLEMFLQKEISELDENNVRLNVIGRVSSLPQSVRNILHESIEKTKGNDGLTLTLALSYGARWDIVRASQLISMDVRAGKLSPEDISEETFANYLQTKDMPDPDLMIRTSGEFRVSNFLLWEIAYGEIFISEKLWPKFRRNDLYQALLDYINRERRFGMTSEQITSKSNDEEKIENEKEGNDGYLKKIISIFSKS